MGLTNRDTNTNKKTEYITASNVTCSTKLSLIRPDYQLCSFRDFFQHLAPIYNWIRSMLERSKSSKSDWRCTKNSWNNSVTRVKYKPSQLLPKRKKRPETNRNKKVISLIFLSALTFSPHTDSCESVWGLKQVYVAGIIHAFHKGILKVTMFWKVVMVQRA